MRTPSTLLLAVATFAFLTTSVDAIDPTDDTIANWIRIERYIGCFQRKDGKLGDFTEASTEDFQSQGLCRTKCKSLGKKYCATTESKVCFCGNTLPDESDQLVNDKCNEGCAGYNLEPCGSLDGHFTIFMQSTNGADPRLYDPNKPPQADDKTSSSSSSTTTTAAATVTRKETVSVTAPPASTSDSGSGSDSSSQEPSGINKAGAAAGAVVGVLLAVAIGVGAFLFLRKQRRKKLEEEYRRSLAVREFAKKPDTDLRLDPVMLQRRMSDGSIADNQDYSRRILKVTNPDGM